MFECFHISSSTLYGVTNLVTEVTKLVTREESLTGGGVARGDTARQSRNQKTTESWQDRMVERRTRENGNAILL